MRRVGIRCLCLLLLLAVLLPSGAVGEETMEAVYQCKITRNTQLREKPDMDSAYRGLVKEKESLLVYEWGEQFCLCGYGDATGYLPTDRLYEFRSLKGDPLPNFAPMGGFALVTAETSARTEKYSGNTFQPGDRVAVFDETGRLPMRRYETHLDTAAFTYVPFPDAASAQPGDVLYAYTTYYNDKIGGDLAKNRQYNIELACERTTGTVLQPGEEFSFNACCAPYNRDNGYVKAPNISVEGTGVAGGVCQVSTTIFNAVLGLPLQINEWEVHRASGVLYVPVNFDACVASWVDFRFVNTLDYPLLMEVLPQRGALTVIFSRAE